VGRNLLGAKVTVVGAGGITESLIRLLEPWRTRIRVIRRLAAPMHDVERTVAQSDEAGVAEVLGDADVVVLAAALTPETLGMVDVGFLDAMADHAWLINVARGGLVDHEALLDALLANKIGGAGLDVTTPEPLPDGHPLWDVPNCIISPHVGNTAEMGLPLIAERVRLNVARWIARDPLLGPVDTAAGY
jgi:phosphoglycerate dehydrogenase-like enzyme